MYPYTKSIDSRLNCPLNYKNTAPAMATQPMPERPDSSLNMMKLFQTPWHITPYVVMAPNRLYARVVYGSYFNITLVDVDAYFHCSVKHAT